jgi:hypothetical protein
VLYRSGYRVRLTEAWHAFRRKVCSPDDAFPVWSRSSRQLAGATGRTGGRRPPVGLPGPRCAGAAAVTGPCTQGEGSTGRLASRMCRMSVTSAISMSYSLESASLASGVDAKSRT